tara:strand:+ start:19484 stop:20572 length:1089 start_codon:yes stop_codon:yes gene_type:complete
VKNPYPQSRLEPIEPLITLKGIHKRYEHKGKPIHALQDVSMEIPQGSITGIIGRSGAGKSTLLRCINALEKPDQGDVLFEDKDLLKCSREQLREARHHIGMIFQHFNLLSRRTVLENVLLPLEITGTLNTESRKYALECLTLVGLEERIDAYPAQLSGGQKQRVAIARALAGKVRVLLCDEATSSLDPETTQDILQLLKNLNRDLDLTVVLITHEISVIRDICHTVYVMDQGRILEQGAVENIFAHPQSALTKNFVQSIFNRDIPEVIQENLSSGPEWAPSDIVLRLIFAGETAKRPVISQLIHEYDAAINIVSGHLDHIGQSMFGTLIISIPHKSSSLDKALEFLSQQHIQVETLGYIPSL